MMITKHGQDDKGEAQRVWTDEKECQLSDDRRRGDGVGQLSGKTGSQSFPPSRIDWARTNSFVSAGDDSFGGTVEQLIAETREEIHEIEVRGNKLRQRLTSLEELMNRLKDSPVSE